MISVRFRRLTRGVCLLAALSFAASPAPAAVEWDIPAQVSQGRAFLVQARDREAGTIPEVSVTWRGKTVPMPATPSEAGGWTASALLAMPLDARGDLSLTARCGDEDATRSVRAAPVPWREDRLTVEPRYVTPPPEALAQIRQDQKKTADILASLRPERRWTLPFFRPVKGGVSAPFGGRRVFNGQPRAPHKGTDMRGPQGTPVRAVAAGTVVLAETQYYSGNVIYVDHGQGVISMYGHLSAFDVKPGDTVERGQVIGRVGATGRVTGPHLHLGLIVQGVAVDAMPLYEWPLKIVGGPTPTDAVVPKAAAGSAGKAGSAAGSRPRSAGRKS